MVVDFGGERALCCDVGASSKYKLSHMEKNLHLAESAKVIYSTGFFIISNFDALKMAAKFAKDNGKLFGINLSAVYICEFYMEQLKEIIQYADFVFGNEDETTAFAKKEGIAFESLHEVTEAIAKLPLFSESQSKRTVITTQGSDPVLTVTHDFESGDSSFQTFEVEEVDKENIMDMNGAGDAFVGGFLSQIA